MQFISSPPALGVAVMLSRFTSIIVVPDVANVSSAFVENCLAHRFFLIRKLIEQKKIMALYET